MGKGARISVKISQSGSRKSVQTAASCNGSKATVTVKTESK